MAAAAGAGASYLFIGFVLWWHAWSAGAGTHTLCACGDPALFLWFFQWPATAVAHLHNPFYSTALFHPRGVNLLAQTSVLGITVPLIPVTWIFGPVAALNVASTLTPALAAFTGFAALRRWVRWAPAAYLGGLLFGFSPFVLSSLEFAHFMTAAVMLLPLILAVLDDICLRHRHDPRRAGLLLALLLFWQFFLSSELLVIVLVLIVLGLAALVAYALVFDRGGLHLSLRPALTGLVVGAAGSVVLLAYPVWFALLGPGHLAGLIWPHVAAEGGFIGSSFVTPDIIHGSRTFLALGGYEGKELPSAAYLGWGLLAVVVAGALVWFRDRRLWFFGFLLGVCIGCSFGERQGQWEPSHVFAHLPVLDDVIEQRFMVVGFLAAAAMLAIIAEHVRHAFPRPAGRGGPEGVPSRAGSARPGFDVLAHLAFSVGLPQPTGTPAQLAAVRHALAVWRVTTVVVAPVPGASFLLEGHDPTYAAAFMTAALGRLPRIRAGAWEWDDTTGAPGVPVRLAPGRLATCVGRDESTDATLRVSRCVLAGT